MAAWSRTNQRSMVHVVIMSTKVNNDKFMRLDKKHGRTGWETKQLVGVALPCDCANKPPLNTGT